MAVNEAERRAMTRALELATLGPRGVNPQVGAVILSPEGDIIACLLYTSDAADE